MTYRAVRIPLEDVNVKYNTNNIWKDGIKPVNYDQEIAKFHTQNWIQTFKSNAICRTYPLAYWMRDACAIGTITKRVPKQFEEEIDDYCKLYDTESWTVPKFIRVEGVSLKEGIHGTGPYTNLRQIIESIITSRIGHHPFDHLGDAKYFNVYFIDWVKLTSEFRMFIHNKKVVALSQQECYQSMGYSSYDAIIVAAMYHKYYEGHILPKLPDGWTDFTIDIALSNNTPYFIEFNTFGKEQAAGSSLFGWEQDNDVLMSDGDIIEIRII